MGNVEKVIINELDKVGCKLQTILNNSTVMPGQRLTGRVEIYGGSREQMINKVDIQILVQVEDEVKSLVQRVTIPINYIIHPNTKKNIPFDFMLTANCPISAEKFPVWVITEVAADGKLYTGDKDNLEVVPNHYMNNILKGMEGLGFEMSEMENYLTYSNITCFEFTQEFEFKPKEGEFKEKFDEIELFFARNNAHITLLIEVDRKLDGATGELMEKLDLDESILRHNINVCDIQTVDMARAILGNILRNL